MFIHNNNSNIQDDAVVFINGKLVVFVYEHIKMHESEFHVNTS